MPIIIYPSTKQQSWLHSPLIDINNKCDEFLPSFSPFNKEFFQGKRLIDSFLDRFSFHAWTHNIMKYICNLDNIIISTSNDLHTSIVFSDTSIRNNIVTFILLIYLYNKPIIKIIHYTVNVTTTKAELFIIRYGIN